MTIDRSNDVLYTWRATAEHAAGELGLALHLARKVTGLTLRGLAEISGVRVDVIQRTERGTWIPTAEQLGSLLDALGASASPPPAGEGGEATPAL